MVVESKKRRGVQFTLRSAFFATVVFSLAFGWYSSVRKSKDQLAQLMHRLAYSEGELQHGLTRKEFQASIARKPHGTLSGQRLDRAQLAGINIDGGDSAFQKTSFADCDLRGATLAAGAAAFQGARFDDANLMNAKLSGGASSFQYASFINADLSNATLSGIGGAFQGASFQRATMVGVRVVCGGTGLQCANIDGAHFESADLSAVDAQSLRSCYFRTPPTYDAKTKFPTGFNPKAEYWRTSE